MWPPLRSEPLAPYCGVGCRLVASADGTLIGDPDHPANRGAALFEGLLARR